MNKQPEKRAGLDVLLLVILAMVVGLSASQTLNQAAHPAEDAAMLMRYSQHLAEGHGIVWNIGEAPVDGATDFLFMLLLALVNLAGLGLESGVRWIGVASHALTVVLVYFGGRRFFKAGMWAAFISAAFVALGPGLRYTEASFGTPFFAFSAAVAWFIAGWLVEKPESWMRCILFAFAGLAAGLARPEGVFLAGFMLLAVIVRVGIKRSFRPLIVFVAMFGVLGGAYFLWHWQYFGYPLPNPFYKKGGGRLYPQSLAESWQYVWELSFPFWLVFVYAVLALGWALLPFLTPLLAELEHLTRWLKRNFVRLDNHRTAAGIQITGGIITLAAAGGLLRTSSALNSTLIFGRYSPKYFLLLSAAIIAGVLLIATPRLVTLMAGRFPAFSTVGFQKMTGNQPDQNLVQLANKTLFLLIPVIGFTCLWVLLSNEMNYLKRFQYPVLPLIMMSWPMLLEGFIQTWKLDGVWTQHPAWAGFSRVLAAALAVMTLWVQSNQYRLNYQTEGRYEVALILSEYQGKGYTIATSEAGLLPLVSNWRAVDIWGLNDAWIAHNGGVTEDYLDRYLPEVIMFHADFSPISPVTNPGDEWSRMTLVLQQYAEKRHYTLAAVYGPSPTNTHFYYIKPGFAESDEITRRIRDLEEPGYKFGSRSINYARFQQVQP